MNINIEVFKSIASIAPNYVNTYEYVKIHLDDTGNIIGYKFTNNLPKKGEQNFINVRTSKFLNEDADKIWQQINLLIAPNTYTDFQGGAVSMNDLLKDITNLARTNCSNLTANTFEQKQEEVEDAVNNILISWGLHPGDIKEDDINLLKYTYIQTQNIFFEKELKNG